MSGQIFFFCTLYDGNTTVIYRCKTESELCCGRGCCVSLPGLNSVWSQWYFWLGIVLLAVLVVVIALIMTSMNQHQCCQPHPAHPQQSTARSISRIGIRHILGVQNSNQIATVVAATGVTCGPTGLIEPSVMNHKSVPTSATSHNEWGLTPLRPPYPLRPTTKPSQMDTPLEADDIV